MTRLDGLRVVVTSPTPAASEVSDLLGDRGAVVVPLPVFEIAEPSSWDPLDDALERLDEFAWLLFTSRNGVQGFTGRLRDRVLPDDLKTGAVGAATAEALERSRMTADFIPRVFTGADLVSGLGEPIGRVLLVRVEDGPPATPEALRGRGWDVAEVAAYRNAPLDPSPDEAAAVRAGDFDAVMLMSPSAARGFARVMAGGPLPESALVACIGPSTARGATQAGLRVDVVAASHTAEGLVEALAGALERSREVGP